MIKNRKSLSECSDDEMVDMISSEVLGDDVADDVVDVVARFQTDKTGSLPDIRIAVRRSQAA